MTEGQLVKPRGKMTPFAFYVFICMEQAKKKHPDKNLVFQMFEDVCLPWWEAMSDFHKKRFVTMAEKDVVRFNKEMEKYKTKKKVIDEENHPNLAEDCRKAGVKGLQRNKKKKELRLGDITSGEEINNSDDQTNSEDSGDEFEGFQVVNLIKPES